MAGPCVRGANCEPRSTKALALSSPGLKAEADMKRAAWSLVGVALALALGSVTTHAQAKRTGMNLPCHNCHEARDKPELAVTLSATRVEPGETVTIDIVAKHPRAKVGGVLVDSHELGAFELVDAVGTHLFENSPTQATHAIPQPYVDGQVKFSFRWVAPTAPGPVELEVWSNAGNDNMKPEDDSPAEVLTGIGVGCDAIWYYQDADKDGTGAERGKVLSCTPVADRITQGGDCDDDKPEVKPGAVETCNSVDDDCDGKIDNGFTPMLLVTDADGDGFGASSGMSMIGCPPLPGYATTFDDCNDLDPNVHPGAVEVANGRDDNCNNKVDDLSDAPTAGTAGSGAGGSSAGGSGGGNGGNTPPPPSPQSDAGCSFSLSVQRPLPYGLAVGVLLGLARVSTKRRRSAGARA